MRGIPAKEWYRLNMEKLTDVIYEKAKSIGQDLKESIGQDLKESIGQDPSKSVGLYKENKYKENKYKENISPQPELSWKTLSNKYGSSQVRFVKRFLIAQQRNWPKFITGEISPNHERVLSSLDCLDKLCRLDGYDFEAEVKPVLEQVPDDEFWSRQVLSLGSLRNKGRNGETKFVNICNALSLPSGNNGNEIVKGKERLKRWYEVNQNKPSEEQLSKLYHSASQYDWDRYALWAEIVPDADRLLEMYQQWLEEQDWLGDISDKVFSPQSKVFKQFLSQAQKRAGVNFLTGRSL
jgi:hypothetical protein